MAELPKSLSADLREPIATPAEHRKSTAEADKHAGKSQLDWSVNNIAGFYANQSTDKNSNIDGAYCH